METFGNPQARCKIMSVANAVCKLLREQLRVGRKVAFPGTSEEREVTDQDQLGPLTLTGTSEERFQSVYIP